MESNLLLSILYGLVQGITEFIPVSSSGHLAILQNIVGLESFDERILFILLLHLGSLAAVFVLYRKDIGELVIGIFSLIAKSGKIFSGKVKYKMLAVNEKFAVLILIATSPLVIAAFLDKQIEALSTSTKLIGMLLIINALILFLSDKIINGNKTQKNALPKNALFVGLTQVIAILPGISRSGSTITSGLINGFNRQFAVKFSFILSIPAILGASIFKAADFIKNGEQVNAAMIGDGIAGFITAFISGLFAIIILRMIAKKRNFYIFSIYCVAIGFAAIIFG